MSAANTVPTTPAKTSYRTLAGFYNADERRISSREMDVGLWWREDAVGPLHRAAWVSDTGELYLVRLGPGDQGGGRVEVLATVDARERLESALSGWRVRSPIHSMWADTSYQSFVVLSMRVNACS